MSRVWLLTLVWAASSVCSLAQTDTTSVYTLQRCIAVALENNLAVRQAGWQTETGRVNQTTAIGNMLPLVSGNANHGINQGRSIDPFSNSYIDQQISFANYGLNGSLTLWNGLSLQNTLKQMHLAYQANQMDQQQARENATLSVMLAYLLVLSSDEQVNQARVQANTSARQVERLRHLDSLGAIAPSQLYDLQGQLANDRLTEVNAISNAQNARLGLAQLMNIPFKADMQIAPLPTELLPEPSALQAQPGSGTGYAILPQIKAADLRVKSANKGLRAARGLWSPSLAAYGNLGTTYSSAAMRSILLGTTNASTGNYVLLGNEQVPVYSTVPNYATSTIPYSEQWRNNVFSSVGISLQVPILNGNYARSRVGLARIAQKQAGFMAQTTRTQVQQVTEQAVLNMQNALRRYQELERQVENFYQSFQAAEARLEAGVGTTVDYIVVKTNLDRARSNLIAARYEVLLRSKVVDYYTGQTLL